MFDNLLHDLKSLIKLKKIENKKLRLFFLEIKFSYKHIRPFLINSDLSIILAFDYKIKLEELNFKYKFFIKTKFFLYLFFLLTKIKFCYSTTPDLGYTIFVKSIYKKTKYIYLQHSLVSLTKAYNKNAFKNFDCIQVCSKFQTKEVIIFSSKFKKKIKPMKLKYLFLEEEKKLFSKSKKEVDILIAPTWNTNFFSEEIIISVIDVLNGKFNFVVRPHYMSYIKDANFKKNFKYFEKFLLKNKYLNFYQYNYLISDWSGIFLEYFLLTRKKSILINTMKKM